MGDVIKVLVTGASGQLGKCIQKVAVNYQNIWFDFRDKSNLDITDAAQVREVFQKGDFDYCINAAAYTNVDEAERNPEPAYAVNAEGVKILANACRKFEVCLIHISTDYVFDGEKEGGYTTQDVPNPINVYGRSKWEGEKQVQAILERYFIIRTSWLYSEYGDNFYKKILEKAKTQSVLYVTDAQIGCPTNANNLAAYLLDMIDQKRVEFGIQHFTDGVPLTWYQFASHILAENDLESRIRLVKDNYYRSFARRPVNSILLSSNNISESDHSGRVITS